MIDLLENDSKMAKIEHIPYSHQNIDDTDVELVVEVLKSGWITQGPKVKEFEEALCKYTGAKYAVVVSSGTAALHIACLAAGIENGDEVVTSPVTFVASANSILYCSGKPVFADVQRDTVNIDPEEIKKRITNKTKAILPVDFAGHPADLESIYEIAKNEGLIIIEDAAHALGSEYNGAKTGSCRYSDMTVFSFHPVKHITTGEGGAVMTNSKDLYEKLVMLRNHGITKDQNMMSSCDGQWFYEQQLLGFNYRITDLQCALGISQLKKLDHFLKRRRDIASFYNEAFSDLNIIKLPFEKLECAKASWHLYFIRLKNYSLRKDVFNQLKDSNIGVQVHYIPVHLQPYYRDKFGYKYGDYPNAEDYYKSTITIPLYPAMEAHEIEHVVDTIKRILMRMV